MNEALRVWLATCGLERLGRLFEENEVDLPTLRALTDADLRELGVPFGPRKRILNLIADERLRDGRTPSETLAATPSGERRQLTVLFCDMVGFTKLAYKLDPETLQLVIRAYEKTCAACVERYDGYVFTMLGDGVVAFFGYPRAHENEAERAIRAGLEIVEAIGALHVHAAGRLQVRVGVALGVVVVAPGERNAVGEPMNLASRLQAVANPGSVVVTDQVRRLTEGLFDYEDLGKFELHGVKAPTRVHRVAGISRAESRFDATAQLGLTPLVGRSDEVEQAFEAWLQSQETRSGRGVLLVGDGGMGKSRIVREVRERLRDLATITLTFQASPFFVNTAFHPIAIWFERAIGVHHDDSARTRLEKLEALVVDRFGLEREDIRLIAAMLSIPFIDRLGPLALSPKMARDETIRVLERMFRAQANAEPTLLIFEDLHWADPTTLDVLARWINHLADIPAFVLMTTRPELKPTWNENAPVKVLRLAHLEPSQSLRLLSQVRGGRPLPSDIAEEIVARAQGVPLFVEELTKAVSESLDTVLSNVSIPATLRDSLMARLDRAPAAKAIAQVGAVIGREISYELLAGLNLMSEDALGAALEQLIASRLATCSGVIPQATYKFSHMLLQDAAYDSLLKSRRRTLHADVARLLSQKRPEMTVTTPELLAYHYTRAEQHKIAAPLWLQAGEHALRRFALSEAVSHLRAGLAALEKVRPSKGRDSVELSIRSLLGSTLVAQRGWAYPEVKNTLEPALRLARSLESRQAYLPILSALAVHTMSAGQLSTSLRWTDEMQRTGAECGDGNLTIVGYRAAAATRFWTGDFIGARVAGDEVHRRYDPELHRQIAVATHTDPFTGEGVYRSQFLWILGFPERALAANAAAEVNARRRGHPFDLALHLTLGAQLFNYLGDWETLLARADEAVRIGEERGLTLFGEILAQIGRGVAWLRAGRPQEAVAQLDSSIGRLQATGHRIWVWYLRALQAEGLAAIGEINAAWIISQESLAQVEAGEERAHYAEMLRISASIAKRRGDVEQAEQTLRKAIEVARAQSARSWELRSATDLAMLLEERGERREGVDILKPAYDAFSEGYDTLDMVRAKSLLS